MGRDEQRGIEAATRHREFLRSALPKFHGRILDEAGDGMLSAHSSAVDAVNCVAIRELFAGFVMPSGGEIERRFFAEVMEESATPEDFAAFIDEQQHFDVSSSAAQLHLPTLVVQARDDLMNPLQDGKKAAAAIAGARFVIIDGPDHIPTRRDGENEKIAEYVMPFLDQDLPDKIATPSTAR